MSAYTNAPASQVISLSKAPEPAPASETSFLHPKLFYEIESVFVAVRQMEVALKKEQARGRAAAGEFAQERARLQAQIAEANQRTQELSSQGEKQKAQLGAQRAQYDKLMEQLKSYYAALTRSRNELENTKLAAAQERKKAEIEREGSRDALDREHKRYREIEDDFRRVEATNERLVAELRQARSQLSSQTGQKDALQDQLNRTNNDFNGAQIEIERVRASLRIATSELERYKTAWTEVSRLKDALEQAVRAKGGELDQARAQAAEAEAAARAARGELEIAKSSDLKRARLEVDLRTEVNFINYELEKLRKENHELPLRKIELKKAQAEIERLKRVYPVRDLIANKERQLDRLREGLKAVPSDHPGRERVNAAIEALAVQRDRLSELLDHQ